MYTLHIYRNEERVLAVHAEDTTEYSAIYIIDKDGWVGVGSDLSDINNETWPPLTWHQAFMDLLVQEFDIVLFYRVDEVPTEVEEKFKYWQDSKGEWL